jgi:PAS domain-containing protein
MVPETSVPEADVSDVGADDALAGSWLTSARSPWSVAVTIDEFDRLAAKLAHRLTGCLGPVAVGLLALEADGSLRLVGADGVPPSVQAAWSRVPHEVNTPPVEAVQRGRPSWLPDVAKVRRRYVLIEAEALWPSRAWLPVRDGNRIVGVAGILCERAQSFDPGLRRAVTRRVAEVTPPFVGLLPAHSRPADWAADTQAVLDIMPGAVCLSTPVRDADGRIVDYEVAAASRGAVDAVGRRGREMVGLRMLAAYPSLADSDLLAELAQVLATGRAREVGPFAYRDDRDGVETSAVFTLRLHRLGAGVLVSWVRHDEEHRYAARLALTERLGNLGWAEWDLTTDTINWSDQLMAIFGRDAADGPARLEDFPRLVVPDDLARFERAAAALLDGRGPMDVTFRVRARGGVRHLRAVCEATYDVQGRPVRAFGIVQDVTAAEAARRTRQRLVGVERELTERQQVLQTEHRLVAHLQQIILPLPDRPIERPGLQVAVRYRPAEETARLGGDWYDLVALPCGGTLLAVGDVAGHGLTAAGTMARLRHALAALAVTTNDPAELLGYLNRLVCDDPAEPTATIVVARYDPPTRTFTWAQAGHPPPILVAPGIGRVLPRPRGTLVGARRDAAYVNADVRLPPDATLLLYTDGLIERRGEDGDWINPVLAALAGAEREPVADLLDRLYPANLDDDTCVLALRQLPA